MSKKLMTSAEVAEELGVSRSQSYKIVRELNQELKELGFMVVSGKVSRSYFIERFFGERGVANVCVQG